MPSPFGNLYYAPDQLRNGTISWVTNHGERKVIDQSGTGGVLEIGEPYAEKLSTCDYSFHAYEMGMRAYQDLKRRIEAGEEPTEL